MDSQADDVDTPGSALPTGPVGLDVDTFQEQGAGESGNHPDSLEQDTLPTLNDAEPTLPEGESPGPSIGGEIISQTVTVPPDDDSALLDESSSIPDDTLSLQVGCPLAKAARARTKIYVGLHFVFSTQRWAAQLLPISLRLPDPSTTIRPQIPIPTLPFSSGISPCELTPIPQPTFQTILGSEPWTVQQSRTR